MAAQGRALAGSGSVWPGMAQGRSAWLGPGGLGLPATDGQPQGLFGLLRGLRGHLATGGLGGWPVVTVTISWASALCALWRALNARTRHRDTPRQ